MGAGCTMLCHNGGGSVDDDDERALDVDSTLRRKSHVSFKQGQEEEEDEDTVDAEHKVEEPEEDTEPLVAVVPLTIEAPPETSPEAIITELPKSPAEEAPRPAGGLMGGLWKSISGWDVAEQKRQEAAAAAAAAEEEERLQQEKARKEKSRALRKFFKVMTSNGLRVQKHHRGKAKASMRVIRYNADTMGLTWESNKVMGAGGDATILLKNVADIKVEGCIVWVHDPTRKAGGNKKDVESTTADRQAVGFETSKPHDAEFLAKCLNYLIDDIRNGGDAAGVAGPRA